MARELGQLSRRIVEVLRAHQPGGDGLLLGGDDHVEVRELLGLGAGTEADIDGHVVARLPVARVDRDPLVAQPRRLRLRAVLADHGVQQREHFADAGLGEDARDHLHLRLRRVEHLVGDGCDLVLQDIGVDALALPRHARAPFARGILVLQQREDVAADIWMRDDAQAAR